MYLETPAKRRAKRGALALAYPCVFSHGRHPNIYTMRTRKELHGRSHKNKRFLASRNGGERLSKSAFEAKRYYTTVFWRAQHFFIYFNKIAVFMGTRRSFGLKRAGFALPYVERLGDMRPRSTALGFQAGRDKENEMNDPVARADGPSRGVIFPCLFAFFAIFTGKMYSYLRRGAWKRTFSGNSATNSWIG